MTGNDKSTEHNEESIDYNGVWTEYNNGKIIEYKSVWTEYDRESTEYNGV